MYGQMLSWRQRGRLWLRLGIRTVGAVLAVVLIGRLGRPILTLFMPFLLAMVVAALLDPVICRLQRWLGGGRKRAALVTLLVILGGIGTVLAFLGRGAVREIADLAENWDGLLLPVQQMLERAERAIQSLLDKLPGPFAEASFSPVDRLGQWMSGWMSTAEIDLGDLTAYATATAKDLSTFAVAFIMFLLACYFLCADYPYLRARAAQHINDGLQSVLGQIRRVAITAFGGYLKAQLLLSLGVFVILLCGFALMGQSYALLLALGLALLDFIPIVGAGTVMLPWAVVDLLAGNLVHGVSLAAVWGVVALFRRLAEPKVVGDQTGLSPILSLVSIYVGMRLGGIPGMVLGPVAALVVLNLRGLGLLDGIKADVCLAARDVGAILNGWRERNL